MAEDEAAQANAAEEQQLILQLQSEQFRKQEQLDRLRQKSKALEDELSTRENELSLIQSQFKTEHTTAQKVPGGDKAKTVAAENEFMHREVRHLLEDRVPVMATVPEEGSEGEGAFQQEEAAKQEEAGKQVHDTVLVSYVYIMEDKHDDYKVTYRIDSTTTVEQLHKDACAYWGCSRKDYALCRLDRSDLPEPLEDPSQLLQEPEVLNPAEQAHLHLVRATHIETLRNMLAREKEKEKKLLEQKANMKSEEPAEDMKLKTLKHGLGAVNELQAEPFVEAFKAWRGVYHLLKGRNRSSEAKQKWQRVPFSDFFMFFLLILLSSLCIGFQNTTDFYMLRAGVVKTLSNGIAGETARTAEHVFLSDNFDTRHYLMWTGATEGVFVSDAGAHFNGSQQLVRAYRPLEGDVGRIQVRMTLSSMSSTCADFFMMLSAGEAETWSAESSPLAVKFAWNCENVTVYTPDAASSPDLACAAWPDRYELTAAFGEDGTLHFADSSGCVNETLFDGLRLAGLPLFLYLGADGDDGSGTVDDITVTTTGPEHVQSYTDIHDWENVWRWLGGPFRYQVFDSRSALRQHYTPVGFLRLRQQRAAQKECVRPQVPFNIERACYHVTVDEGTRDMKEIPPHPGWDTRPPAGENVTLPNPLFWQEGESVLASLRGHVQTYYDGSGYMQDYYLSPDRMPEVGARFGADLEKLRRYWVTPQTRMLAIELTLANYNLGGFVAASFLLEIPPSGAVYPSHSIVPFHVGEVDGDGVANALDIMRWIVIIAYVMTTRLYRETLRKVHVGKTGLFYIFSTWGFVDMLTVATFFAIQFMRLRSGPPLPTDLTAFHSYTVAATMSEQLAVCEASFLLLLVVRFASFMRMSPAVFQLFKSFAKSLHQFAYFVLAIFGPIFFGTIFFANAIWSPSVRQFRSWTETLYSLVLASQESFDVETLFDKNRGWTIPFLTYFYLSMIAFFVNIFLAITVHAYFEVALVEGSEPDANKWSMDQWMDWMLWPRAYSRLTGRRPGSSQSRGYAEGEELEDEGSDDEEDGEEKQD